MIAPAASAREAAIRILSELRRNGHVAYLAGGCVRDALLGKSPKDYDIATNATPDVVQRLFPRRSAAVGAAFGVVIVYTPKPSPRHRWVTEVATFRAEGAYSDGRRPDSVRYTTAEEDAKRRDFTINGLFADPAPIDCPTDQPQQPDRIIDFVHGKDDLQAGIIRAIGDPAERFGEDYLRMLRAIRFAARLGFAIEPKTAAAIRANARYLGQISRERIGQELLAMLDGPRFAMALHLLQSHKLDAPTLNEDPADVPLPTVDRLVADAQVPTKLAAWMIDRLGHSQPDKRAIVRWRKALTLSNEHRDDLARLFELLERLADWPALSVAARKRLASHPGWPQAMLLRDAIAQDAQTLQSDAQQLANDGIGLCPAPFLTGEDLIAMGLEPGPSFKTLLEEAYDRQLQGDLRSHQQALTWLGERAGRP